MQGVEGCFFWPLKDIFGGSRKKSLGCKQERGSCYKEEQAAVRERAAREKGVLLRKEGRNILRRGGAFQRGRFC